MSVIKKHTSRSTTLKSHAVPGRDPASQPPELLTRKEAAAFLRATDQFVDRLIIRQQLPCIRFGFGARKQVRIRRTDLLEYLRQSEDHSISDPTQHTRRGQ